MRGAPAHALGCTPAASLTPQAALCPQLADTAHAPCSYAGGDFGAAPQNLQRYSAALVGAHDQPEARAKLDTTSGGARTPLAPQPWACLCSSTRLLLLLCADVGVGPTLRRRCMLGR